MDFDRIFRSLFGIPEPRNFPNNDSSEFDQEPLQGGPRMDEQPPSGFFFSGQFPHHGEPNFRFGFTPPQGFGPSNDDGDDDDDDDDHGGHNMPFDRGFNFPAREPFDMMRHFEEVFRGFDELFRGFGMADFPPPSVPAIQPPPPAQGSLRDQMLKEPDSNSSIQDERKPDTQLQIPSSDSSRLHPDLPGDSQNPDHGHSSIFGRLWTWTWPKREWTAKPPPKVDTDLDQEVLRGNLDVLLPGGSTKDHPESTPGLPGEGARMQPDSHYHGVSVYTFRSADGKLEERRTYQDGYGNKEEVITRGIGDQAHTVTITRTPSGREEKKEELHNMEESDKENFENHWETPQIILPTDRSRSPSQRPRSNTPSDSNSSGTSSMFKNLFGFHFPGFPKADR